MKLPNGYGCVTKLSGNRRKPYLARVTLGWNTDEQSGSTAQNRVTIGTYKTKKEALQALAEYSANPYDIQNDNLTLAELYQKWTESYFPHSRHKKYRNPLGLRYFQALRPIHLQNIFRTSQRSQLPQQKQLQPL